MAFDNGVGSPLPVDVRDHVSNLCRKALGRRLFPASRRDLTLANWPGKPFLEEQFDHSDQWALGRLSLEGQTVVVGMAHHLPSGARYVDSLHAAMFLDRHTSGCALSRAVLSWLQIQEAAGQPVRFRAGDGQPAAIHPLSSEQACASALQAATASMFDWQREALRRLAVEAERDPVIETSALYRPVTWRDVGAA
ncbi:MAG: hypothetical protein AAFO88_07095 [Pseudomonadota bacterium]